MTQPHLSFFDVPIPAKKLAYPHSPGFKSRETSATAAAEISADAPTLRESCLTILQSANLTADEVADRLDKSVLAIRPRITELAKLGKILDSGERRPNLSNHKAIVWSTLK